MTYIVTSDPFSQQSSEPIAGRLSNAFNMEGLALVCFLPDGRAVFKKENIDSVRKENTRLREVLIKIACGEARYESEELPSTSLDVVKNIERLAREALEST
jgi:hypothetical protein